MPQLAGVSLANTNIRDGVFAAMTAARIKGRLAMPAAMTNATQVSNVIQTLVAMEQAGLVETNRPPPPNPYEWPVRKWKCKDDESNNDARDG